MDTKKLRQKILDLAIRGKLVPQDPNDEPASVLLERIKAEKERLIKEGKIKRSKKSASDTSHYENLPFEIPESWVWTTIDELFFVTKLAGFEYTEYFTKENVNIEFDIPIVRAQNVRMGRFVENQSEAIKIELSELLNRSSLTIPCLLMTFIGAGVGDTCIFPALKRNHLAPNVAKMEPYFNKLNLDYFLQVCMSSCGQEEVNKIKKSTAQPSLSMATIRSIRVPMPPIQEQIRIANATNYWLGVVDRIEYNKKDISNTIEQVKNKILSLAITGKLVKQIPSDEPAIELLKRINPTIQIPCDNPHYQKLPNGWAMTSMQNICQLRDGEKRNDNPRINLDVKYLRGKSEGEMVTSGKYVPSGSTMILVDGENSGEIFTSVIEGYQGSTFKLLDVSSEMNMGFVLLVIKSHQQEFRENKVGSAIPHLNKKLFKEIAVMIPPIEEQQRIVESTQQYLNLLEFISDKL